MARLVVGIGNPGPEYAGTRHNVGFIVADILATRRHAPFTRFGGGEGVALVAETRYAGRPLWVAKPQSYVNRSGPVVLGCLRAAGAALDECLVVLDDVALPVGRLRLRAGGSAGGHHGLESIVAACGSETIPRLRIGVGHPGGGDLADYVLAPFTPEERPVVDAACVRAADAVEWWVRAGLTEAMNRFNVTDDAGEPPAGGAAPGGATR